MKTQLTQNTVTRQRLDCSICNYRVDPEDSSVFSTFACNVRAHQDKTFQVWRCPSCQTIHCLDVVDLDAYYENYPIAQAQLSLPFQLYCRNQHQKLLKYGLSKTHTVLDYGCGHGLLVQYLRKQGYKIFGYDPYAPKETFGDSEILQPGSFNYIVLQDVIEHVENPHELLSQLNQLLAPGGYILIGTPNATNLDLSCPHISDYYNAVHVPYHLHLYTRQGLEYLAKCQEWEVVEFYDRPYNDTRWFSLNSRSWNEYLRHCDGSLDSVFEPIQPWKVLTSPRFFFYALFGYWLSLHLEMTLIFRKPAE